MAIKKITNPFTTTEMAKRCLREVHLLRTIDHPNIIQLLDTFLMGSHPDMYFVMTSMPMDLRRRLVDQVGLPLREVSLYGLQLFRALYVRCGACACILTRGC